LLDRSPYEFDRHEALSFYFESEMEMKRRTPGVPYAQILADSYGDVALRLGLTPHNRDAADALLFAQSVQDWPCMPHAEWLLYNLARSAGPRLSIVAIADVDHDFLLRTPAFASLAPFFEAVFTWDACRAYKPDPGVFDAPLRYYDALGVGRAHSFLVSGSLLRDMEPAREVGVPAVWVQCRGSLAANMCTVEDACPAAVLGGLFELGVEFFGVVGAPVIFRPHEASNSEMDYNRRRPLLPQPVVFNHNQNVPSFYSTAMYNQYNYWSGL
jgi:FMN phosphatase YigB (HAD superfamily)